MYHAISNNLSLRMDIEPTKNGWNLKYKIHYNLQLVFIIYGPSPSNDSYYYIAFLDAYSKYAWLYLIHKKSQASIVFKYFKLYAKNQYGFTPKSIQIDNAREFLCLKSFLHDTDTHHHLKCSHNHEQNGSIEWKHRHIINVSFFPPCKCVSTYDVLRRSFCYCFYY